MPGRAAASAELAAAPVAVRTPAEPAELLAAILAGYVVSGTTLHWGRCVVDRGDDCFNVIWHLFVGAQRV